MRDRDPLTGVVAPFPMEESVEPPELEEFLAQDYPAEHTLLGPIKSQSIVHCAAATGVGKTQMAVAIAMQLIHGAEYWHWDCPRRRSVLFVDGEMPARKLQERFRLYRRREEREALKVVNAVNWASKHKLPHPNLADPEWQGRFMQWGADLDAFIFDNVMSLVSVPGENMSSDQFWKPIYDFNLRARAAGKTVIWLDHTNAEGRAFGTRTKEWAADLVFTLKIPDEHVSEDGCVFTLVFTKTRGLHGDEIAPCEFKLLSDRDGFAAWTHTFTDEKDTISVCTLREKGLSQREIAEELGFSVGKVNKLCRKCG